MQSLIKLHTGSLRMQVCYNEPILL